MEKQIITAKNNRTFVFRELQADDAQILGDFFVNLSAQTRSRFGPHLLTQEHASLLCSEVGNTNITRFIVENESEIAGYFILDFNLFEHEKKRYHSYGTTLDCNIDPVFAPCIADKYQNSGIASQVMLKIIEFSSNQGLRSLVLMGGTQQSNHLARSFYKKFGFEEYGSFTTEMVNIDMKLNLPGQR
ncbi:GNAT family N-acetyltransferase [Psychromonas ossibalaenae]|uniref:GNAT family N-acetyltransferase n=1 Tax=Psychromonas ossibalaenae TaxID=444922 RepID=UPI00036CD49A|nr:GNAT family N-acetyltransferase [Psychromonas ossibalaenae]